ncbi:uncharacterized protein LOC113799721 [Dermatophagoides pteronyssinus]|uniref:uncharacterized protein LOC113799721 n=1 Tax=Dermatophagoides pteronyssinus TaxID=6956 RepID=UPI003F67D25D
MYARLIIFVENCQHYISKLILWTLIINVTASQFTLLCLKNIKTNNQWIVWIITIYFLLLEYSSLILLTYFISKFNSKLNSIRWDIERIVHRPNLIRKFGRKFCLLTLYERMINIKPWGLRIGTITVLTKAIFTRIIIVYARFTLLSNKFT